VTHDKEEIKAKIAGRRVVASISGGKDSAAMSLYLTELGIEHDRVFMDTGWEHEATYEYLRGTLTQKIGPIKEIVSKKYPESMVQLVIKKGMFASRMQRFCTQELKVFPMRDYICAAQDTGDEVLNTVGIRRAESEARSKMPEWEWNETMDCEVWRPLIFWSEQDVIDIHKRHDLAPNPLYLKGAERVGCWPCVFARKSEIRFMAENYPKRIDFIRDLEAKVAERPSQRYADKGETFESLGFVRPAFFQEKTGGSGRPWPIDEAVKWSKTSHGGAQYEMFAANESDAGCMRWGLCETNPDKEDK
jgi:3'-phosphoadenosine 5'-phosphosulfate sulfotransferase (PAPS reductase)/FAD synthetase